MAPMNHLEHEPRRITWKRRAHLHLVLFPLATIAACGDGTKDDTEEVVQLDIDMGGQAEEMSPPKKRTPLCEENQRVQDHQCIPCEPGRERPAGDDPDGINTWCESMLCEVNERVEDFQCVPCPIEEYNDTTFLAADGDTTCLRDACSETIGAACKRFHEAYIKAESPKPFDGFGKQVSLHGDLLAVSMPGADELNCLQCGAVFIYERTRGGKWHYRTTIASPTKQTNSQFGTSVILRDDLLLIGASKEHDGDLQESGAVYLFSMERGDPTSWRQLQRITAFNAGTHDNFGTALALSEDRQRLVISAPFEDGLDDSSQDSGAVYLFEMSQENTFKTAGYIRPNDLEPGSRQGTSLAIGNTMLAIGAPNATRTIAPTQEGQSERVFASAGFVYLYTLSDQDGWSMVDKLYPEVHDAKDYFGTSLALVNDDRLLVGAPGEDSSDTGIHADVYDQRANSAGAAYLFEIGPQGALAEPIFIKPGHTMASMEFGYAVAMTPDMIAIGARKDSTVADSLNGTPSTTMYASESGAVFVFRPYSSSLSGWQQIAAIKAREEGAYDRFGEAVSVDGYTIAIGAPNEDSSSSGTESREGGNGALDAGAVYIRNVGHFKYR